MGLCQKSLRHSCWFKMIQCQGYYSLKTYSSQPACHAHGSSEMYGYRMCYFQCLLCYLLMWLFLRLGLLFPKLCTSVFPNIYHDCTTTYNWQCFAKFIVTRAIKTAYLKLLSMIFLCVLRETFRRVNHFIVKCKEN